MSNPSSSSAGRDRHRAGGRRRSDRRGSPGTIGRRRDAEFAARLQALAEPDAVVIASGTRRLVGDLFEYRDLGAVEVKGLARRVPAWQVLRASIVASRFEALRGSVLTPLIGRGEEIDLLLRRWARAKAGDGEVVLISASQASANRASSRLWRSASTPSRIFACAISVRRITRTARSILSLISLAARPSFSARRPARRSPGETGALLIAEPRRRMWHCSPICCHCRSERHPSAQSQSAAQEKRTLEALTRQLEGLARRQLVLMVFEDAHWIDPTSRELLDLIVERVRNLPVLLIVTFRPEFQSPWTGELQVTMLASIAWIARSDRPGGADRVRQDISR